MKMSILWAVAGQLGMFCKYLSHWVRAIKKFYVYEVLKVEVFFWGVCSVKNYTAGKAQEGGKLVRILKI